MLLPYLNRETDMDLHEIDLEFMEQEQEDRLSQREATFLGLASDFDRGVREPGFHDDGGDLLA